MYIYIYCKYDYIITYTYIYISLHIFPVSKLFIPILIRKKNTHPHFDRDHGSFWRAAEPRGSTKWESVDDGIGIGHAIVGKNAGSRLGNPIPSLVAWYIYLHDIWLILIMVNVGTYTMLGWCGNEMSIKTMMMFKGHSTSMRIRKSSSCWH